jgi:hypothetical protein
MKQPGFLDLSLYIVLLNINSDWNSLMSNSQKKKAAQAAAAAAAKEEAEGPQMPEVHDPK